MSERVSRRRVLATVAAGSGASLAGCSALDRPDPERERLLSRIETLEAEVDQCEARLATLRGLELEARSLDERPFVGPEAHDRAAAAVRPLRTSVVKVLIDHPNYEDGAAPPATGWVYDDGLVATNKHVADPGNVGDWEVTGVETFDGDVRDCEVLASAREVDGALLEVSTEGLEPLPTGRSEDLRAGDPVVAVGHPSTVGEWVMSLGAYRGERAGRSFVVEGESVLGNSGSPMVDADGVVVGMLSSGGAIQRFSERIPADFEREDFLFDASASCTPAAFERYPPRSYVMAVKAEELLDRFEEWHGD